MRQSREDNSFFFSETIVDSMCQIINHADRLYCSYLIIDKIG